LRAGLDLSHERHVLTLRVIVLKRDGTQSRSVAHRRMDISNKTVKKGLGARSGLLKSTRGDLDAWTTFDKSVERRINAKAFRLATVRSRLNRSGEATTQGLGRSSHAGRLSRQPLDFLEEAT
jgi:hypothetical protein